MNAGSSTKSLLRSFLTPSKAYLTTISVAIFPENKMSNSTKTIIFVPGAWHGPEHFDQVAGKLQDAGYQYVGITLKSNHTGEPLKDFTPDVEDIRAEIDKAADAGQEVIVVGHSYGGIPASQAIQDLDLNTRKASGKPGGVSHLFYLASFIIPEGSTLIGAFGGDLPWFDINESRTIVNPMTPIQVFYNDLPEDEAQRCVETLRPFSYQCMHSKLDYAAWKHGVPTTYLYTLQDQAIPMFVQKMMVEETAKGYDLRTDTVDASHSPFLSKVDDTANAIRRAAGENV